MQPPNLCGLPAPASRPSGPGASRKASSTCHELRRRGIRIPKAALRALLALLLSVAWALSAGAHSEPVETEPGDGEILESSPTRVVVGFSQELESGPSGLQILDEGGHRIDGASGGLDLHDPDHRRLQAILPLTLPPGSYVVQWTAVSAEDGDQTEGRFRFTVEPRPGTAKD